MWISSVVVLFARLRERNDISPQLKMKVSEERLKGLTVVFLTFLVYRLLPGLTVPFCQTGPVSLCWWSISDFSCILPVVCCGFKACILQATFLHFQVSRLHN